MSYFVLPKTNGAISIRPIFTTTPMNDVICCSQSLHSFYYNIKQKIETICCNTDLNYEELIKSVNTYEYVFFKVPGSTHSVSKLTTLTTPLTNEFYNLIELVSTHNVIDLVSCVVPITTLHMASTNADSFACINLFRENNPFDKMLHQESLLSQTQNQHLYCKIDIMFFNQMDQVQTLDEYILYLVEIVLTVLEHQLQGGTSIIKIDYLFHAPVVEIIYILSHLFEKIYINKPNTSNVATFEKYIVCKHFIVNETITQEHALLAVKLKSLRTTAAATNLIPQQHIASITESGIPLYFMHKINDINIILGNQQLDAMNQIVCIVKNKQRDEKTEMTKKSSIQKAVSWCEKFKIPCNKFTEKTNIFLPFSKQKDEVYNTCG